MIYQHKIEILNFVTFHMGKIPDATKLSFDLENEKTQKEVSEIVKLFAKS